MKVKELIERLEAMNPDSEIVLENIVRSDKYGYWAGEATTIIDVRTNKDTGDTVLDGGTYHEEF